MSDGAIARYYGRNLGMIAGLFAFLQVLVSVSSARANLLLMRATQDVITNITNNIVQTPLNLLSDLVPTLDRHLYRDGYYRRHHAWLRLLRRTHHRAGDRPP